MDPPREFQPLESSPFGERAGPFYIDLSGPVPIVGLWIERHHTNRGGRVHGGLLATVADIALSYAIRARLPAGATMWTADLHVAFLEGVGEGEWVEAVPSVERAGRSLVHGSCVIRAGESQLASVLATFAVRVPGLE